MSINSVNDALYNAAIDQGSIEGIDAAIACAGADVNFMFERPLPGWSDDYAGKGTGNSVLHVACWLGLRKAIVDRLLELSADIHLRSTDRKHTPLHCASYGGNIQVVALLLDKGCDPNAKDAQGSRPISCASCHGHKEIIELLLDRGSDIHCKNFRGITPLIYAAQDNHKETVQLLLKRGANICDRASDGTTALQRAAYFGHDAVVDLLLSEGADIDGRDDTGRKPLMVACCEGKKSVVDLLLVRGAYFNGRFNFQLGINFNFAGGMKTHREIALGNGHLEVSTTLTNWPVTMAIVAMQELVVYHLLDFASFIDLFEYIGWDVDYL